MSCNGLLKTNQNMKHLKKSPFLKKEENQRILVFESYIPGEGNRAASISEEEYQQLLPHVFNLSHGSGGWPKEIDVLVWETISDRSIEVRKEDYEDADIVVAVC